MVRNILAVIVGWIVGGLVNMALINVGPMIIALPTGADTSTFETLSASMHLLETEHYIFPFLAHALGTLVGGLVAALIAASNKLTMALIVGVLYLLAGIYMAWLLPAPLWFEAVDILLAYIPMAWIGARLGGAGRST